MQSSKTDDNQLEWCKMAAILRCFIIWLYFQVFPKTHYYGSRWNAGNLQFNLLKWSLTWLTDSTDPLNKLRANLGHNQKDLPIQSLTAECESSESKSRPNDSPNESNTGALNEWKNLGHIFFKKDSLNQTDCLTKGEGISVMPEWFKQIEESTRSGLNDSLIHSDPLNTTGNWVTNKRIHRLM